MAEIHHEDVVAVTGGLHLHRWPICTHGVVPLLTVVDPALRSDLALLGLGISFKSMVRRLPPEMLDPSCCRYFVPDADQPCASEWNMLFAHHELQMVHVLTRLLLMAQKAMRWTLTERRAVCTEWLVCSKNSQLTLSADARLWDLPRQFEYMIENYCATA